MALASAAEMKALPLGDRVRAATARVVAKYSPALTPEFVFEHVLPDTQSCADWLSSMIAYYSAVGSAGVASLSRLCSIAARAIA
jgi:hypothetical protein